MKLTIIPDVHGRPFWRDAVKDVEVTPVIFLGDYLDPYPQDIVTWEDAIQGLNDIIELKKKNPERVTLLLGNHDVHYLESYPFFSRGGRMNHERFEEIRSGIYRFCTFFIQEDYTSPIASIPGSTIARLFGIHTVSWISPI